MDVEPGAVRTQAEPENEGDEPHDEEQAQEDGADHLGDPGGEVFPDPVDVVAGRVVPLHGSGLRSGRLDRNMVLGSVNFLSSSENGGNGVVMMNIVFCVL